MTSPTQISPLPFTVFSCDPLEKDLCEKLLLQCFHEQAPEIHQALEEVDSLPFLWLKPHFEKGCFQLGIYCLGPFRQRFFKYFYEFCFNICLQKYEPDPLSCTAVDFVSHQHPQYTRLTLCRIQMQLQSKEEVLWLAEMMLKEKEQLRPGLWSGHLSDWSAWQKMAAEDEKITRIAKRWADLSLRMNPELAKVASEKLQQLIANLSKSILADRTIKHILHIACAMALPIWRQNNSLKIKERSSKRRAWITHSQRWIFANDKRQLMDCYTITLNYLRSHEMLDERHILQALKKHSGLLATSAHFFMNFKDSNTKFHHFYLEIPFDYDAFTKVQEAQPNSLKHFDERILSCIERKQSRIFQPRNDEETLKRLVNLAKEVQSEQDIAQVILSFDEQTDERLVFCLLIARPILQDSLQKELMEFPLGNDLQLKIEKRRKVEENSFAKELILAKIEVAKAPFVREDYSVDLHRSRLFIMKALNSLLGSVRDYNGGLIAKQHQLLEHLLEKLGPLASHQQMFIEEIFFSLQPSVATASFEHEILSHFFMHLLQAESTPKPPLNAPRIHWKSFHGFVFLASFSDEQERFSALLEYFQHRLNEGSTLVYGELQQPYRFIQVALLQLDEEEEAKNLKNKIHKLLNSKDMKLCLHDSSPK